MFIILLRIIEKIDFFGIESYNNRGDYIETTELAIKYNADLEIVQLAALLHDISMVSYIGPREEHHIYGAKITEKLLTKKIIQLKKLIE